MKKKESEAGKTGVSSLNNLPIDAHRDEILTQLCVHKTQLLVAAPGTGKSTRIPPFLSQKVGKTLLIQPRRTAAKMLAHRIAEEWGCTVGMEVGYQIRFDACYGKKTQLLIVTEGIARQRMLSDPFLEEFSVIILDEVHERSLNSDILLELFKELRTMRPELHIQLISATIDPQRYIDFFESDLHVYTVEGRKYDITIHYEEQVSAKSFSERLNLHIQKALQQIQKHESILVFLPGKKSIQEAIEHNQFSTHKSLPLYSSLPFDQQMYLFEDFPKIIFSTNVAESSITLPRIGAVIDSGLEKISIDQGGFGQLQTVDISLESADQRTGRAGRTQHGHSFRMWRSSSRKKKHRRAEIEHCDITQAILHIMEWGMDIENFSWLTPPSPQRLTQSIKQLHALKLINDSGITKKGRTISRIPVHPRIGCVLHEAHRLGVLHPCAELATLLVQQKSNIDPRAWKEQAKRVHHNAHDRRILKQLLQYFPKSTSKFIPESIEQAWLSGYPDRIAKQIDSKGHYLVSDGAEGYSSFSEPWLLALQIHKHEKYTRRITGSIPISIKNIPTHTRLIHVWKDDHVEAIKQQHIGAIIIKEQNCPVDLQKAQEILCIHAHHKRALHHTQESRALLNRIDSCRKRMNFPTLESLIPLLCIGKKSFSDLRSIDLYSFIQEQLSWEQKQCIRTHAPQTISVPSGAQIAIDYTDEGPITRARTQQLFGLVQHPHIGHIPIIFEILAPNNRPQQRTQDITKFWTGSYLDIRKELRGRYPKHAWPEHPTKEDAENRPRRKRSPSRK